MDTLIARPSFRSSFWSKIDCEPSQPAGPFPEDPGAGPDAIGAGPIFETSDVAIATGLPCITILTNFPVCFYCKTNALSRPLHGACRPKEGSSHLDVLGPLPASRTV